MEAEERILKAALKVVNEVTINGTRMHLIAEKAGMVQSNIHYYYKTKGLLMEGLLKYILDEFHQFQKKHRGSSEETLESQLHVYFEQKKYFLSKKKEYDYAELNFIVQSKIDKNVRAQFEEAYTEWRDNIREIIIKYCPEIDEENKEMIPYLAVSLLEGATIQVLLDQKGFDIDGYFAMAEEMVLNQIRAAVKNSQNRITE